MDDEIRQLQAARAAAEAQEKGVALGSVGKVYDKDIYGESGEYGSEVVDLPHTEEDADEDMDAHLTAAQRAEVQKQRILAEGVNLHDDVDPMKEAREAGGSGLTNTRIADRESEYQQRGRRHLQLSPERGDAFTGATPARSYRDIMAAGDAARVAADAQREKERAEEDAAQQGKAARQAGVGRPAPKDGENGEAAVEETPRRRRKRRWDDAGNGAQAAAQAAVSALGATPAATSQDWAAMGATPAAGATPGASRWDATPDVAGATSRSKWADATPQTGATATSRWDATPTAGSGEPGRKRSRWDETPAVGSGVVGAAATPLAGMLGETPAGAALQGMETPDVSALRAAMATPDVGMGATPGLMGTPTPMGAGAAGGFRLDATPAPESYGVPLTGTAADGAAGDLPTIKPEDMQYFGKLADGTEEDELDKSAQVERKIMRLLLKIKNGTPPQRKSALRVITDKAKELGAGPLFQQILPILMSPALEDQERHLMVKVIDRILYKLGDLVRPYVHKILVVIEPLLIDEEYYARVEGREIISNLSKAAGLATMIATMRPDIDHVDEYVRNTTARAFAVVASTLGVPALLPFLKAVCQSRKSWQARHTGIKILQQIAILMGCAVLPHLKQMVDIVEHGLVDEQQKVRTITALAIAALAEAAYPYGIESFDGVLVPLWKGIRTHRGKGLAAFLKAIGFIIPLMDADYANFYTKDVMVILIREFQSPDEEMKKIVLKVVKQCVATDGVAPAYVRADVLPEFLRHFWVRRMALDRRNYRQVVEVTTEIANKVGAADVVSRIVDDLKDESEPYRKMVMETVDHVIQNLGAADIAENVEEQLIDGVLYAFQEQTSEDTLVMLNGFGTVVNALGTRARPYLPQICGTIKWRLNNQSSAVRMQAADLIARIASCVKRCGEEKLLRYLGQILFEYLGEEFPDVLGSILGALKAIVNVIGMNQMTPPIRELLPRLTPILRNRHEKVQENCIDLVGRIADRGAEHVSAREWMRICFELLEMLKAHKKAIRRAAVNTFGYIAKAIGPQDVLHTLLSNLKVQERQMRVCTTVAIAIVAETCGPFTVLPALMNEYRIPDLNVQNGVLKALSFMFEYIGEMGKDYVYAVLTLLEDALQDRDLVHRQTAMTTVKHIALGVSGLGCEDALLHLLNHVWPNVLEESPHVINACFDACEGLMVGLGPGLVLMYILQGLFHPARRVRDQFWRLYNSAYIMNSDAMVAAYPVLEEDSRNRYARTHLELFI